MALWVLPIVTSAWHLALQLNVKSDDWLNYHWLAQTARGMGIFSTTSFIFMISKTSTSASTPFVVWSCFGACALQAFCFALFFWFGGVICF